MRKCGEKNVNFLFSCTIRTSRKSLNVEKFSLQRTFTDSANPTIWIVPFLSDSVDDISRYPFFALGTNILGQFHFLKMSFAIRRPIVVIKISTLIESTSTLVTYKACRVPHFSESLHRSFFGYLPTFCAYTVDCAMVTLGTIGMRLKKIKVQPKGQ